MDTRTAPCTSRRRIQRSTMNKSTVRMVVAGLLLLSALLPYTSAWPLSTESLASSPQSLEKRANRVNYTDPNTVGGHMLTIIPNLPDLGEPINAIVSGLSDESVLTVEGFLLWVTSINFGVSCLGQANGTLQSANLGNGNQTQGTGDGDNGVLRWNYGMPYIGTCKETFVGGNHFRWFKQDGTNAYFLATSVELDLSTNHMIAQNGYNAGRDELVGNATISNGTQWEGNVYKTTVDWIEAGVLLNATSDGINHPSVALEGQPTQDGRVALLTVRQLASGSNGALGSHGKAPSIAAITILLLFGAALAVA